MELFSNQADPCQGTRCTVEEHGSADRPGIIERCYNSTEEGEAGPRIVVRFTDERGGSRDCFARSVTWQRPNMASYSNAAHQESSARPIGPPHPNPWHNDMGR